MFSIWANQRPIPSISASYHLDLPLWKRDACPRWSSHPSRSNLLSPVCRTSSSRTPRPRKIFSLNDPGRICDTDAAPLHNQLRPTGRIPVLFDSLFPFALKFDFGKGESYFSKGKAKKWTLTFQYAFHPIVFLIWRKSTEEINTILYVLGRTPSLFQPFVRNFLIVDFIFCQPIIYKFRIIAIRKWFSSIHSCHNRSSYAIAHNNYMLLRKGWKLI